MYFDANNLYGYAMSEKMPYKNFKWIREDKLKDFGINFILNYENENLGYLYEVDLEYPIELHDRDI